MDTRTVDVVLQRQDGRVVARLTVGYPAPQALAYGGEPWHRADGFGIRDAVYHPDAPFRRPPAREQRLPVSAAAPRRRR